MLLFYETRTFNAVQPDVFKNIKCYYSIIFSFTKSKYSKTFKNIKCYYSITL